MSIPDPRKVLRNLAGGIFFLLMVCCRASGDTSPERVGVDEHLGARIPLDITFRDESGAPVLLSDLVKGPTIILPVYYRCSNVCSVLQTRMASVLQTLERTPVEEYRVISVSFDEEETPEMAARSKHAYLSAMKKPFPEEGWRFLTGDLTSIRRLTDALGFGFQRQRNEFAHPVAIIVVAGDGMVVRYLYGVSILSKDLALALVEARSGVTGGSIRKLMDYCFSYDPAGRTYVFNLLRVSATVVILCTGGFLVFLLLSGKKKQRRSSEKS
jgi:protein SCO1